MKTPLASLPRCLAALAAVCALGACTVGPDYERPEIDTGTSWAEGPRMAAAEDNFIAWWRDLGDPELTRLVERALSDNLSVRQAIERVAEARARRQTVRADYFPNATAESSANIQRQSANANPAIGNIPGLSRNQEIYETGFSLSWEIDLFGRTRRAVEASDAQIDAARADANGARLSVATETARTYLEMRGYQAERAAREDAIDAARQTLSLVETQFEAGEVARVAVVQARVELRQLEADLPGLRANVRANALALGVLTGRLPETEIALESTDVDRIELMPVPVGQRADILRRRPDIAAAERRLASETAEIGVATAELFPRLSISAFGGFQSLAIDTLFESESQSFSVIPFLSWRIFDGGRVRAEIRLAEAEARRAALAYEETVLNALGEAEEALARYDLGLETMDLRRDAVEASRENFELAQLRYRAGDISLLELFDAERRLRDAERAETIAYRRAAASLVALYGALGGGWQPLPEDTLTEGAS
ncbi:MAG: efflux transporter outer membrane subunit [Parasphingopyxis sp.]|uniref:efflux transporter outer membrane subunit n=1 Tax=Parasphingopyxis sp. TaxID=1920299 RepID=UPI003F9F54C9